MYLSPQAALATTCATLSNSTYYILGNCSGTFNWTSGNLSIGSGGTISGTTDGVTSTVSVGTLTNGGVITGTSEGLFLMNGSGVSTIGAIINAAGATIQSTGTGSGGIDIGALTGTVSNSGLIATVRRGIDNEYTITTVINNAGGTILATSDRGQDIANNGSIGSLINNGSLIVTGTTPNTDGASNTSIAPNPMGIANYQTIATVTNTGLISISGASATGVYNGTAGTIGTITNTGRIVVTGEGSSGIGNYHLLDTLNNSGTINANGAGAYGLFNKGTLASLINSGVISADGAGAYGVYDRRAVISSLVNSGTISAAGSGAVGIAISSASGTVATIVSLFNSGTIAGEGYALSNGGSLGQIVNSGVIAGNISSTAQDLSIAGGSGGSVGTLTGYAANSVGTIVASGVTFTSGSLWLNDAMTVGSGQGTVKNNASLQINRALTLAGNYLQASAGTLVIGVSSASSYGELVVSGAANLTSGHVALTAIDNATFTANESFTIVSAGSLSAGGVTVSGPTLPYQTSIIGNNLVVSLSSWTQTNTPNGPITQLLDQWSSQNGFQTILSQLAQLPAAQQTHAIKQLGTSQLTPQVNASGSTVAPTTTAVEQHQLAALDGAEKGAAAGSDMMRGAFWGQVLGGHATRDTSTGADGYTASSVGLLFGADVHPSDEMVTGLAASWLRSYSRGKADSAGNRTTLDSYQLTGYGTWRPDGGPAYAQGLLGVAYNDYDQKRGIDYLGETALAKFHGWQYQAKIGGGYDVPIAGMTATPVGSMQVVRVENNAYRETGAGAASWSVNRQGFNAVESELGAKLAANLDGRWNSLAGDLQASWVHSYTNSPIVTAASVIGGSGYSNTTARPAADGARVTAGVSLQESDGRSLRLEYDGDLRRNYRSHTGLIKIRAEF
ncbi:autotransporter outer membrane beta-barrel domain-containing protein [Telmatospirillum siberiense]|nr:autotransporter domain-containing protein [Telmatospirillum siberiense]